jgi:aryl-alcohol dehydrogenase-like predicted oxidoreductase
VSDRDSEDVLDACAERGLGFIPWFPLATDEARALEDAVSAARG